MPIDIIKLLENPNDPITIFNLALILLKKGNIKKAISEFKRALSIDSSPKVASLVYPNLGYAYMLIEEYDKAIKYLESSLTYKLENQVIAFIYANLGYIYSQRKHYGIAILLYRSSLEYKNDDLNVLYSLASIYESKLQYDLAYSVINRLLELNPEYPQAHELLYKMQNTNFLHSPPSLTNKFINSLGIMVVPYYDYKQNIYLPKIIFIAPESPLNNKVKLGDIITSVSISGEASSESNNLIDFLEGEAGSKVQLTINNKQLEVKRIYGIDRDLTVQEQTRAYSFWLQTFDSRLVFLWNLNSSNKKQIGIIWGQEFESLIKGFETFSNNPLYHFAYAVMIEHLQPIVIDNRLDYQIDLSQIPFKKADNSIIQIFKDNKFNKVAEFLSKNL